MSIDPLSDSEKKMQKRKQHAQRCLEEEFVGEASGSGSPLSNPSASFNEVKESHRGYSLGQKEVAHSGMTATP